jgi:hypothetical protein
MSLIGKIAIAMGVDTTAMKKGFASARKDLNAFASNVTSLGLQLGAIGAIGALAIGKVVTSASNLEEQTDRTRDQFGKFADQVIDQSNLLATAFGLSKVAILESSSVLSAIFESAGYAGKGVADLSVHFVKLSTDLSRFANIPFKEALRKIESGLVGQVRPLREVGVALSEAATDAYAYKHGIAAMGAELTDSQKVQARAGFIADALTKSWGNTAKTGDKVAGAIEGLKGRFENLSAAIGDSLLILAAPALGDLQVGIQALQTSWVGSGEAALKASGASIEGLTAEHHSIGLLQQSIGYIADGWQIVGTAFKSVQLIITSGIMTIVDGLKTLNDTYIAIANLFGKNIKSNGILEGFQDNFVGLQAKQVEEFKKQMEAPWAHEAIDKGFEQGRKDIQAARDKLAKMGKLDVNSIKPDPALAAATGKVHQGFAAASAAGSQEAASTILRSRFGMGGQGPAEKTAANTAKTNVLLGQLIQHLGAGPGAANLVQLF